MLPLRISVTTSRQACSRQLRRCVAQLGPTTGFVKFASGMSMWKRPLQPSGKLSRHGRLVKALEHHNAAQRIARHVVHHAHQEANKVYETIDPKSSEDLANQFRGKNADVVGNKWVKNDAARCH